MSTPQRQFSPEQIDFLRDGVQRGLKNSELFDEFEQRFGEPMNQCMFWKVKKRNGIHNKEQTVAEFTEDERVFVSDLVTQMIPQRKIVELFNQTFGKNIGQTQLRRMMRRSGIESVKKERTAVPIGYEYYSSYYKCKVVKVSHERNGWKLKQNLVWEQAIGKQLPRHSVVIFLDGNRDNYAPDNLYAVPLHVVGNIEKWQMHSEEPMIYKSALMYGELYFLMMKEAPEVMDRMKRKM